MPGPGVEVSVVVASHGRPELLPSLLDALAAQALAPELWEVVLVHTYGDGPGLASHELARAGHLRQEHIPPASARPSHQRNVGWRAARGKLIAFTDDDCRP